MTVTVSPGTAMVGSRDIVGCKSAAAQRPPTTSNMMRMTAPARTSYRRRRRLPVWGVGGDSAVAGGIAMATVAARLESGASGLVATAVGSAIRMVAALG